jgi:hypothetical protein
MVEVVKNTYDMLHPIEKEKKCLNQLNHKKVSLLYLLIVDYLE